MPLHILPKQSEHLIYIVYQVPGRKDDAND